MRNKPASQTISARCSSGKWRCSACHMKSSPNARTPPLSSYPPSQQPSFTPTRGPQMPYPLITSLSLKYRITSSSLTVCVQTRVRASEQVNYRAAVVEVAVKISGRNGSKECWGRWCGMKDGYAPTQGTHPVLSDEISPMPTRRANGLCNSSSWSTPSPSPIETYTPRKKTASYSSC